MRTGRGAVGIALLFDARDEKASCLRLAQNNLRVLAVLLDCLASTVKGSSGSIASDPIIKLQAAGLEVVDDLRRAEESAESIEWGLSLVLDVAVCSYFTRE